MTTIDDIRAAARRIDGFVHRTPVMTSATLDEELAAQVFVKCENLQKVGAFKARGACNAVMSLSDEQAARGVGERCCVVAAAVRHDAARGGLVGEREDRVAGAARLECPHLLQVLALDEDLRAELFVQRRRCHHGRAVHAPGDPVGRRADVFEGGHGDQSSDARPKLGRRSAAKDRRP